MIIGMSYMSARLTRVSEYEVLSEDDRLLLRDAAAILGEENLAQVARMLDVGQVLDVVRVYPPRDLGRVLGVTLAALYGLGATDLPGLLRWLADRVESDPELTRVLGELGR